MVTSIAYLISLLGVAAGLCPEWQRAGGSHYCLVNGTMTWGEGTVTCSDMSGIMAVPTSDGEHQFIWQMFKEESPRGNLWIGCRYDSTEARYVQPGKGDKECGYTKWVPGEPSLNADQRCLQMWRAWDGLWDDTLCNHNLAVICERLPRASPVSLSCMQADDSGRFTAP